MSSIGWNIKNLRERMAMSQEELADKIGKTRSAISQYESGKIIPRMGVIEDLASVFDVSKNVIISGFAHDDALSEDENTLINLYRRMDDSDKSTFLEMAYALAFAGDAKKKDARGAASRDFEIVSGS